MLPAGLRRLTTLLVEYEGDTFLHERKILAFLPDDALLVLTPHGVVCEERVDSYARVYVRGIRGGLPDRWYQPSDVGHTVLFNDAYWQTRKDAIAAEWRVRYPSPRHGSAEAARAPAHAAVDAAASRVVDGTAVALAEHPSSRLKEEASTLKERREAREERHLVGGGDDGGGAGGGGRHGKKKCGGKAAGAKGEET